MLNFGFTAMLLFLVYIYNRRDVGVTDQFYLALIEFRMLSFKLWHSCKFRLYIDSIELPASEWL